MSKRKELHASDKLFPEESSSDEEQEVQDIDFEWFDPQPEHDHRGLKILLTQLFDVDAQHVDLGALTDLILSQPLLGSTVKVGGNTSDPCAFLTVLSSREHRENSSMKSLVDYLATRLSLNPAQSALADMLKSSANEHVGIVLSDRLINVPPEVAPPMYRMLQEEITWAIEEKEPYTFSHYLVVSKAYQEKGGEGSTESDPPIKKRAKLVSSQETQEVLGDFHPEDQVLRQHASAFANFPYQREQATRDSDLGKAMHELGLKPQGHVILCEALNFEAAIKAMESQESLS